MEPYDYDLGTRNLRLEREGPILWCTIDRPKARNAFTPSMYFGIKKAVRLVNSDKELRALIITGTGDVLRRAATWAGAMRKATSRCPKGCPTKSCPSSRSAKARHR